MTRTRVFRQGDKWVWYCKGPACFNVAGASDHWEVSLYQASDHMRLHHSALIPHDPDTSPNGFPHVEWRDQTLVLPIQELP